MADVITGTSGYPISQGDYYDDGTDLWFMSKQGLQRVTDIGSSSFTSPTVTNMVVGASTTGIAISGACTTGISITGATTNAISIANGNTGVAIKIGSLSSTVAGSGAKLDSTVTRIVEVNADDADTARTAGIQGRAIMGRLMSYAGTTQEDWAVDGLTKLSAVVKTANVNAGVVGRFETTGTCSTDSSGGNTYFAGVMGRVGVASATTIGAGAEIAAVLAFNNTATTYLTHTGDYCAFLVAESAIGTIDDFDIGLKIKDSTCVTGINIGTCATGISIGKGVTGSAIRIGNWAAAAASGSAVVFNADMDSYTANDGQLDIVAAFGESTSDLTSANSAKVGRFRHVINTGSGTTINHETYGLAGQLVAKAVTLGHLHAGLLGTIEGNTTAFVVDGAYTFGAAAIIGRVGGSSLITATKYISGVTAFWNSTSTINSCAFSACSVGTATWGALLGGENCTNLLYVPDAGTAYENAGVKIGSITTIPDTTADGVIRIYVGATPYYIPVHAAGSINGL